MGEAYSWKYCHPAAKYGVISISCMTDVLETLGLERLVRFVQLLCIDSKLIHYKQHLRDGLVALLCVGLHGLSNLRIEQISLPDQVGNTWRCH